MERGMAQRAIESLRKGIPPEGLVEHITVGRTIELDQLRASLDSLESTAFLIRANFGAGKSHLLRYVREYALGRGCLVGNVTVDVNSAVRFNRMDQILGATCRGLELSRSTDGKGIRAFLGHLAANYEVHKHDESWMRISNSGRWDYSSALESSAMFVAIRAWFFGGTQTRELVEAWLTEPWNYRTQRKLLFLSLVQSLPRQRRDRRPEWKFYADEVFMFHTQAYVQSWAALRDLHTLAQISGLRGLIILFDEFEDVLTNMKNKQHRDQAFWNLLHFFEGEQFNSRTFFAVTPEFAEKANEQLMQGANWAYGAFAGGMSLRDLPSFEMSPLSTSDLLELANRIALIHGRAYNWNPDRVLDGALERVVAEASRVRVQDRTRHAITQIVKRLDDFVQDES